MGLKQQCIFILMQEFAMGLTNKVSRETTEMLAMTFMLKSLLLFLLEHTAVAWPRTSMVWVKEQGCRRARQHHFVVSGKQSYRSRTTQQLCNQECKTLSLTAASIFELVHFAIGKAILTSGSNLTLKFATRLEELV